ncbi:Hsp20/alpha crystallin family protein [Heyndrickxia acidicola]|uniref:Hsp20/alpha crystallin family protein n=1 Tax=Heyndrickxia acidicola TaxID=209389 RepID=A0ABU6MGZ7_9BACI|nr:Hsp20/alpha crystallin family protein [Heyndrickxia acidicola]MED1203948.1 Hsp20/alpha crystallin family protein [Heyndrickxia acidicola]
MKKIYDRTKINKMLGPDFFNLLSEVSPFVSPRIDVFKTDHYFVVLADVAGAHPDELRLTLQDGVLFIEGYIHNKLIQDGAEIIAQERFYGQFQRSITIPAYCLLNKLKAHFKDGILMIQIPMIPSDGGMEETIEIS